jgi:hypothetical protein
VCHHNEEKALFPEAKQRGHLSSKLEGKLWVVWLKKDGRR